jgi:putative ABC transport system substrate-binding protein
MKKRLFFSFFFFLFSFTFLFFLKFICKKNKQYTTVAIIQCASNPSLDLLRETTITTLKKNSNEEIAIILKNADASLVQANTIASQLYKNKDIDVFFTIGSGPTLAISHLEKKRPIVFSGISDPADIGLIEGKNITGIIDSIEEKNIASMVTMMTPHIKNLAILRTHGEISEKESRMLKKYFDKKNIACKDFTVLNEIEVMIQTKEACRKADALFVPTDSIVASAISFVIEETKKNKIPLFLAFNEPVSIGALAACGINYEKTGEIAGNIIATLLKEKNMIKKIPFQKIRTKEIYVNKETAQLLKIELPQNKKEISSSIFMIQSI